MPCPIVRVPGLLPLAWLAALALPLTAQTELECIPHGVTVTVSPNPAEQGEPVLVELVNDSPFTIVLTSSCLFGSVHADTCGGELVGAPNCLFVFTAIPSGTTYASVWDQKDVNGNPVPPGTYALPLDFPTDCCPTVTVRGTCTEPPEVYGFADQGTGGFFPTLVAAGFPFVGNADFGYELTAGLGGTFAVLGVGFGEAAIPFDWGTLLLDPFLPIIGIPGVLAGELGVGGAGTGTFGLGIPPDPTLAGAPLLAQAFLFDPASDGSLSHSWGVRARICP